MHCLHFIKKKKIEDRKLVLKLSDVFAVLDRDENICLIFEEDLFSTRKYRLMGSRTKGLSYILQAHWFGPPDAYFRSKNACSELRRALPVTARPEIPRIRWNHSTRLRARPGQYLTVNRNEKLPSITSTSQCKCSGRRTVINKEYENWLREP